MDSSRIEGILAFIGEAERLKTVLRSAWTRTGRQESTADHTWRLCLLAMMLKSEAQDLDFPRVLEMALVHDLGEALSGDVPAPLAGTTPDKDAQERTDSISSPERSPTICANTCVLYGRSTARRPPMKRAS